MDHKVRIEMDRVQLRKAQDRAREAELARAAAEARAEDAEQLLAAALYVEKQAPRDPIRKQAPGGRGDVTALVLCSDWHVEEEVEAATVNGLNRYDLRVAAARTERLWKKVLFLSQIHRKSLNVRRLCVALLGDLISGQLREEAIETSQLSPTEALFFAVDQIRAGLQFLLKEGGFESIDVVACSGNHGRTVVKPRAATRTRHSYEWVAYQILARELPQVRWKIEEGYHVRHKVADWPVRFHHGDAVKYQGGVGGIAIPVAKAISQWNKAQPAYLDCFGHWHQTRDGGNFLCNGSLIGYNAFALQIKADFERPQQTYALLDKEWGRIMTAPIFVEATA